MIKLTRLNREPLVLNSDLIEYMEYMEVTPDTVITLTTGQKLMGIESTDEVIARVIEFRPCHCKSRSLWPRSGPFWCSEG